MRFFGPAICLVAAALLCHVRAELEADVAENTLYKEPSNEEAVVATGPVVDKALDEAPVLETRPRPDLTDLTFLYDLTTSEALDNSTDDELSDRIVILNYVMRKLNGTLTARRENAKMSSSTFGFSLLSLFNTVILSLALCMGIFYGFNTYLFMNETPANPPKMYSVVVPNSQEPGKGPIRRNFRSPDKLVGLPKDGTKTLYEAFQKGLSMFPSGDCFGYRPSKGAAFVWQSYSQVAERATSFGSGLEHLDLIPTTSNMKMLCIYMKNNIEWGIAEQACYMYSACTVPLYDTLGAETVSYVLNQTEARTVLCTANEIKNLIEVKEGGADAFKAIVQVGTVKPEDKAAAENVGLKLYSFEELEEVGKANRRPHQPPTLDMVSTFCYTSGTTGNPKGVLLTHQNMIANFVAFECLGLTVTNDDAHLSYLPLAHVFERAVVGVCLYTGARVGFFQGDTRLIMDDLKALRPTIFPSVPRLLNRVYDGVMQKAKAAGGIKTKLFMFGLEAKKANLKKGYLKHPLWDRLVFEKVSKTAGLDRCRCIISGSAPLPPDTMEFLRCVFGVKVIEGYGQTETSAAACFSDIDDYSIGHVGPPQVANEIRLVDVPEMGYTSKDTTHGEHNIRCVGRGEICFRGYNVFKGYYKLPDKTAETLDAEGWCHSGDIGIWLPDGRLKIVDRKKNIFKLAQGEYIAAEKIENAYAGSPFVGQCFVYGDSFQAFLVGVVHPDEPSLMKWASENGISGDFKTVCANEKVKKAVLADMIKIGKERKLHGFEQIKDVYLNPEAFSPENNTLTPTFKLKRNEAKLWMKEQINKMYAANGGHPIQM